MSDVQISNTRRAFFNRKGLSIKCALTKEQLRKYFDALIHDLPEEGTHHVEAEIEVLYK